MKTVKDYAKAVANHALPAHIMEAAEQAGWIPPAHVKRGPLEGTLDERTMKPGAGGTKKGSKLVLSSNQVAARVVNGGKFPPELIQAALAAGWKRLGTAPTGGEKAGKGSVRAKGEMSRARATKPGIAKHDGIYIREAKLSTGQIHGLLSIMEHDPNAEQFVLNAINNDLEAESFTECLVTKWLRAREVIPAEILAKRDAEALAEAGPEAYFEKFNERDAFQRPSPKQNQRLISKSATRSLNSTSKNVMQSQNRTSKNMMLNQRYTSRSVTHPPKVISTKMNRPSKLYRRRLPQAEDGVFVGSGVGGLEIGMGWMRAGWVSIVRSSVQRAFLSKFEPENLSGSQ